MRGLLAPSPFDRLNKVRAALPALVSDLSHVQEDAERQQEANTQAIQVLAQKNNELESTRLEAVQLQRALDSFEATVNRR